MTSGRLAGTQHGIQSPWFLVHLIDVVRQHLPSDPGFVVLRRSIRAALVIPAAFAFAQFVLKNPQTTLFVSFGCFSLLVLADYGGPRAPRALAYVTTALIGAAFITFGTLVSAIAWQATLLMFVVAFCVQFAGVFGGYVPAAQSALLLSFVLAASIPAPSSDIGSRLLGWAIAGSVSTLAGVFVWPHFERLGLRAAAAEACRSLAVLIATQRQTGDGEDTLRAQIAAERAVQEARQRYARTPKRPAGPSRRDRAFVEMLSELERALDFAKRPFRLDSEPLRPCLEEGNRLAIEVVDTLDRSSEVLAGGEPPNLSDLNAARDAHREVLDAWAERAVRSGMDPRKVLAGLDADHALRVLSYLALAIGINASLSVGADVDRRLQLPPGTPLEGSSRVFRRIGRTIRLHLTPSSAVLQQSLRVGVGLALAVLLARVLSLSHAFWVVLGTLSVLRSNALGTGRTTIQALEGTIVGFAVGVAFTLLTGTTSVGLWITFPIAVFLATYAAGAIGFVVGQAAFTVLLIILFNLITPVGWRVGLARVEDVAVGVGISVLVSLLLWPRGAQEGFAAALASHYRAVAGYLSVAFSRLIEYEPRSESPARLNAARTRELAGEAFDRFVAERGKKAVPSETAAFLVAAGSNALLVGDLLNTLATRYTVSSERTGSNEAAGSAAGTLRSQTQLLLARFLRLADGLDGTRSALLTDANVSEAVLRATALECLKYWGREPAAGRSVIAAISASEWLQQLGELTNALEVPVEQLVAAASEPWWH